MSALRSLGLYEAFENEAILADRVSLYEWMISKIKSENMTSSSVTNALFHDLLACLQTKKSRFDQHDPKKQLTKAQIAHILSFMICRMNLDQVTPKLVRGIWNYVPKEQPPTDLWPGIKYVKKQASEGTPTTGVEEDDGGGDHPGVTDDHVADRGDSHPQGAEASGEGQDCDARRQVASQAGGTGIRQSEKC